MTHQTHRRHLRLIWQPPPKQRRGRPVTPEGWIIQYCTSRPHTWTDLARFDQHGEATRYLADIRRRDRVLLEAEG